MIQSFFLVSLPILLDILPQPLQQARTRPNRGWLVPFTLKEKRGCTALVESLAAFRGNADQSPPTPYRLIYQRSENSVTIIRCVRSDDDWPA